MGGNASPQDDEIAGTGFEEARWGLTVATAHDKAGVGRRFGSLIAFALGAADPGPQGTP